MRDYEAGDIVAASERQDDFRVSADQVDGVSGNQG